MLNPGKSKLTHITNLVHGGTRLDRAVLLLLLFFLIKEQSLSLHLCYMFLPLLRNHFFFFEKVYWYLCFIVVGFFVIGR